MQNHFSEYGLPKKIISDAGGNFISDKFKRFCKNLNIEQGISSSYYHQSNGQVEACIKFIKLTIKNAINTKSDMHIALLQIRSTPLDQGFQAQQHYYFNPPIRGIMPIHRLPISSNNDEEHYEVLVERQTKKKEP